MRKKDLMNCDKAVLIDMIEELQSKLKRKNSELYTTRTKLSNLRGKLTKMKDTVVFQRKRILELYQ